MLLKVSDEPMRQAFDFRAEAGSAAYSHPLKHCWSEMSFKLALRFGAAARDGDGRRLNALSIVSISTERSVE
jgi:hypothetical protein